MIAVRFPDIESARKAALGLEHHGFDGSAIDVRPVADSTAPHSSPAATSRADRRMFRRLLDRALIGGAITAVVLAVVVVVLVLSLDLENTALWLVAGLAGALIVGSVLGGFFNSLWSTPMSRDTLEAMELATPGAADVVVTTDDDDEARAEELLLDAVES